MWYTVESGKSTIRSEGTQNCEATYKNLREIFRLPSFTSLMGGLEGNFSSLMEWNQDNDIKVLPFTFEKEKRIKLNLVPKNENVVVGNVWYGDSKTISATFNRTGDAKDVLEMFYPHTLAFYGNLDSPYSAISIREIVEGL